MMAGSTLLPAQAHNSGSAGGAAAGAVDGAAAAVVTVQSPPPDTPAAGQGPAASSVRPLQLQSPPPLVRPVPQPLLVRAMPVVMLLAAGGMVAVMVSSNVARNPLMLMFPLMMALSTVAMVVNSWQGGNRKLEMAEKRRDYLRYLDVTRGDLTEAARTQHARLVHRFPPPEQLELRIVGGGAPVVPCTAGVDVRLGTGTVALDLPLVTPDTGPVEDLEPVSVAALRQLVQAHSYVHGAPVAIDITTFAVVSVWGDVERVRRFVMAVIAQIAAHTVAADVQIAAVCANRDAWQVWDVLKWLPHHADVVYADGAGAVRLTESSFARMEALLGAPRSDGGHTIIVSDGDPELSDGWLSPDALPEAYTVIEVCTDPTGVLRSCAKRHGFAIDIDNTTGVEMVVTAPEVGEETLLRPDMLAPADADVLFRAIAAASDTTADIADISAGDAARPRRYEHPAVRRTRGGSEVLALLGHGEHGPLRTQVPGSWDAAGIWSYREGTSRLRVPIGWTEDGETVELDLKEAAHGGHGPHGLCVGATGSGKSEFLRTLVLGLVATHSPAQLNLVLVDFKGGATFRGLETLHHVAASITNLADEETLVDRMRDALEGELVRRQELLRRAGAANVAEYERQRRDHSNDSGPAAALAPLPALFVVVDEFSELLTARPDFVDLFVQIGRLGRSLQIHLLLASQRLEEGRLRGLESHLSYRVALKTFSAAESRVVLGTTDAYTLPGQPGAAYLKTDAAEPIRFTSAYVSGPLHSRSRHDGPGLEFVAVPARLREFSTAYLPVAAPPTRSAPAANPDTAPFAADISPWELCIAQLSHAGPRAHEIWLEPLRPYVPLARFATTDRITTATGPDAPIRLPWAIIDRPFEQRHDLLTLTLDSPESNAVIIGAPRSGKSTALATLVLAAALHYSPEQLHVYAIDYGGGRLAEIDGLPHTAGIARRGDHATGRRILAEVSAHLRRREHTSGPWPHTVVLIDGWHAARADFDDLDATIGALAAEGLGYNIHVIITASRLLDIRPVVRDALSTRIELRLVDPADSMLGRRGARVISANTPGRGVIDSGHLIHILAPSLDTAGPTGSTLSPAAAVTSIAQAWRGVAPTAQAPRIRLLPEHLRFADIAGLIRPLAAAGTTSTELKVPVGLNEADLGPAYLDLAAEPLTLVFGNGGSGKTSLLRGIARALVALTPASELRILLVDYRRKLRDVVPPEHLAGIATSDDDLQPMVAHLAAAMRERLNTAEQTPTGPRIIVLVDDIDLVIGGTGNPLAPLVPLLAHAADIGLSLVLTRRVSGAARGAFDPVVQRMRDLGATGLVLDGTKDEGRLVGDLVARPLPPGRAQFYSRERGTGLWQLAQVDP